MLCKACGLISHNKLDFDLPDICNTCLPKAAAHYIAEQEAERAGNAELRAEINALNMSHSITVGELRMKLNSVSERLHSSELEATTLAAQLEQERAKLATMVCGTCKGARSVAYCDCGVPGCGGFKPCPDCQPKKGT